MFSKNGRRLSLKRGLALAAFFATSFAVHAEEAPPKELHPMAELTLEERRRIEDAIVALERAAAATSKKRRGRPPK